MFLLPLVINIGVMRKDRGEIRVISTALLAEVLSVLFTFMETFSGIFDTLVFVLKNVKNVWDFVHETNKLSWCTLVDFHVTFAWYFYVYFENFL